MDIDSVIHKRMIIKEASLRMLAQKVMQNSTQKQNSQEIISKLDACEFNINKAELFKESCQSDLDVYNQFVQKQTLENEQAENEILTLKKNVAKMQKQISQLQEYEYLAKFINSLPTKQELQNQMNKLDLKKQNLERKCQEMDEKYEVKNNQLQLLLFSIHELVLSDK